MTAPSGIITLLTDFGLADPFVGVMKGVILSRFRAATVVDLTHGIPPQDVRAASFWLSRSWRWFPVGTVHVAVVDPGVGSTRAALAARAHGHLFVAPDNGLLWEALRGAADLEVRRIDTDRPGFGEVSRTFHGRDVFAKVAADLASGGLAANATGPVHRAPVELTLPAPERCSGRLEGLVVVVDRFGNAITNIDEASMRGLQRPTVIAAGLRVPVVQTYSGVERGELLAVVNAAGVLEVAERDGSAARRVGLEPGSAVVVEAGLP